MLAVRILMGKTLLVSETAANPFTHRFSRTERFR
jgi:hypothetical protein